MSPMLQIRDALRDVYEMSPADRESRSVYEDAKGNSRMTVMLNSDDETGIITLYDKDDYALLVAKNAGTDGQSFGLSCYVYGHDRLTPVHKFKIRDADILAHGLISGGMMRACEFHRLKINGQGYDKQDIVATRALSVLLLSQRAGFDNELS